MVTSNGVTEVARIDRKQAFHFLILASGNQAVFTSSSDLLIL